MIAPLLVLPVAVGAECELPAWMRDVPQAIRDSSDLVVEATVVGMRVLSVEERAEAEVTLAVESAWRSSTRDRLRARIMVLECGPEPNLGVTYFLGLRQNWLGEELVAFAAMPHLAEPGYNHFLGVPSTLSPSVSARGRVWRIAGVTLLVLLVAIGFGYAREMLQGRPNSVSSWRRRTR